jgi:hypothetical protein
MAHGTWHMAHGTWHMAHGTWHMAHGTWHVRSIERMQYFIRVGGRRYGKPYGICQKCNYCVYFQNFKPQLSMVNQHFSKFVQLRKCGESSYLSIAKKTLDLNKNSSLGDFPKSNTHSKSAQVVISAVVHNSIKHGRINIS